MNIAPKQVNVQYLYGICVGFDNSF